MESIVSGVIGELALLLEKETKSYRELHEEVERIKEELKSIKVIVKATSEEEEQSESLKNWVKQVRDVTHEIENVLNVYVYQLSLSQPIHKRDFRNLVHQTGQLIGALNSHGNLASTIKNITALLQEITKRGQRYDFVGSRSSRQTSIVERYHPQFVSPLLDNYTVGIDSEAHELIERLTEGESKRTVISLVGTGGIGKTTLARKLYNNEGIRRHFDFHAWINVSLSYNVEELLKILVMEICTAGQHYAGDVKMMQSQELIRILMQFLQTKRYMLVFDGVREEAFWHVMKDALPDNAKRSRIIITTRSETVAAFCKESSVDHVHEVRPLSETASWDLFCRIVFRDGPEKHCLLELEHLSDEIFDICKGLPLATVAIAGLLSTKEKTVSEWRQQLDSLYFDLISDPHVPNAPKIICFCLEDLPPHLKSCILYFSLFPAQYSLSNHRLIRLWIAEGFIEVKREVTLEDVAEDYLYELYQRNLIQAHKFFYGSGEFYRVHDTILEIISDRSHEIVLVQADEAGFTPNWNDANSSFRAQNHQLSIHTDLVFSAQENLTSLDFSVASGIQHLPENLGYYSNLKYLCVKNTNLKSLPKSVGELQNLETLDLSNTLLIELPVEINKLRNLRHLLASRYDAQNVWEHLNQGVIMNAGIGCLEKLCTLVTVEARHGGIDLKNELQNLQQLRTLGISGLTAFSLSALCATIEKMNHLQTLSLYANDMDEYFDFEDWTTLPHYLRDLVCYARLWKLPDWISSLHSLSTLFLSNSRLTDDPLKYLCVLPNLESLWLYQAYEGDQLRFEKGGFKKLKLLVLRELHGLEVLEIGAGTLSLLEVLQIGPSLL